MRSKPLISAFLLIVSALPAAAQDRLSLGEAIDRALANHPAVRASDAAVAAAAQRITQARSGYLPRLSLVETAQRGNQPVFAFSSLLAARQFTASDFGVGTLNHPDAITNYHTGVAIEQSIFDGMRTQADTRAAELGRELAETERSRTRDDLVLGVTRAYGQVLLALAAEKAADAAVRAADEDARHAEHHRDAGLATEADVLALQVHLAQVRERRIRATSDEAIARAELNQAIGEPLDRQYALDEVTPRAPADASGSGTLESQALDARPEVRAAGLQEAIAREARRSAKAAFLPQISFQGFLELNSNGAAFSNRASAWMFGAQARWNLFSGMADVARVREAGFAAARAAAERERAETAVRLDVKTAVVRVQSAAARVDVGQVAVAQARESQRIIRDRYEAGMASVTDVLRAANAVLDAESQAVGASVDLLISNAMLDRALGRSPNR